MIRYEELVSQFHSISLSEVRYWKYWTIQGTGGKLETVEDKSLMCQIQLLNLLMMDMISIVNEPSILLEDVQTIGFAKNVRERRENSDISN